MIFDGPLVGASIARMDHGQVYLCPKCGRECRWPDNTVLVGRKRHFPSIAKRWCENCAKPFATFDERGNLAPSEGTETP